VQTENEAAQITAELTRLLFNGLRSSVPVSLLAVTYFASMPLSSSLDDLEQAARNGKMESVLQAMPGVSNLADATLGQLLKLQAASSTL